MEKHPKKIKIKLQTFLAQLPLFHAMTPSELDRIALGAAECHVARGDVIFQRGDPSQGFYVVIYGQVKLACVSAQGAEKVVELIGPGMSFGEAVMFMEKPHIVMAQALADTLMVYVSKATVFDELARDPAFARKMLAGMSRRMHGLICDLESYALRTGPQRVVSYLLKDEPHGDGDHLHLPVTKAVVASRLNLTPEHFSRILSDLAVHGLIAVSGRDVTILDSEGLRQHAG